MSRDRGSEPEAPPSRCLAARGDPRPGRGNQPQTPRRTRARARFLGDRRAPGWGAGSRKTRERRRESSTAAPPSGAQARGPGHVRPSSRSPLCRPLRRVWPPHPLPTCPRKGMRGRGGDAFCPGRRWGFLWVSARPPGLYQGWRGWSGEGVSHLISNPGDPGGGAAVPGVGAGAEKGAGPLLSSTVHGGWPGRGRCLIRSRENRISPRPREGGLRVLSFSETWQPPGHVWWVLNHNPFLGCAQGTQAPPPHLAPKTTSPTRTRIDHSSCLEMGTGSSSL